jgi:hypothetical protein
MRDTEIVEEVSMRLFKMHMAYSKEYNARNPCSVPMKCNLNEIKANLPDITSSSVAADIRPFSTLARTPLLQWASLSI